jgi:muramoyltetrapeptide carboxypeptidase LdcA involved in peptidoglycan recycling
VWDDAAVIEATRFGRLLPQGGCIGVPAPASPWENRSDLLRGVEWWQARGYRVKLADGIEARDSYVAGDPKSRARDLEAMFADPEVDVVQCLTGGFGSMQLVPHLDFQLIADHPKAFCGYSDITALHVALRQRAGLATFYGPHLMTMGWTRASDLTRQRLLAVLAGVVGVAVGDMERCDWSDQRPEWPRTKSLEQVLEEHLEPLGVPVLYGLPIGHARHLATLPLGVRRRWTPTPAS